MGVLMEIVQIVASIATLTYPIVIVLPKSEKNAKVYSYYLYVKRLDLQSALRLFCLFKTNVKFLLVSQITIKK